MKVLSALRDGVGLLTLNRPEALNALDLEMIRELRFRLKTWAADDRVRAVVLTAEGERAFCAGGDVRSLRTAILSGNSEAAVEFFREEYALDGEIADYPKPLLAFADGVTMGGGIGIACHARYRVATERSVFAMPETRIGFSPDVGGNLLLARAPGRLGEYLALTGNSINATDARYVGLVDQLVDSDAKQDIIDALVAGSEIDAALAGASAPEPVPEPELESARDWIDAAFEADSVAEIISRLERMRVPAAQATVERLRAVSPTSLVISLEGVRRARELDELHQVLAQDLRVAAWIARTQADMPEGIRAVLVDKDHQPSWNPSNLADVDPRVIEAAFGMSAPRS